MQNVKEEILRLYPGISEQEAIDYALNLINFFKLGIEIMIQTEVAMKNIIQKIKANKTKAFLTPIPMFFSVH
ncbi:MAG: hypothetical protein IKZ02_04780 [Alphaproteobacteria bacterium]|nr:hypothetical protein [Alphaproteobacteria bacterium]